MERLAKLDAYVNGDQPWRSMRFRHHKVGFDDGVAHVRPDGTIEVRSWHVSGHNGDPYGEEVEILVGDEAVKFIDHRILVLVSAARQKTMSDVKKVKEERQRELEAAAADERLKELGLL